MLSRKRAYMLQYKVWLWVFKHPEKHIENYPYYKPRRFFFKSHPLCEHFLYIKQDCSANGCVGWIGRCCFKGAWFFRGKPGAAYIASKMRRECRKNGWRV